MRAPQADPAARRRGLRRFPPCLASCLAAALLLVVSLSAMAATPARRDELVAVVPGSLPPLYGKDQNGRPTGFAAELLRHLAARAGYHVRFVLARDPAEARRMLARGEADVLPGMPMSPVHAGAFGFTRPIESLPVYIYTRAGAPARETLADLSGVRVAALEGGVPAALVAATSEAVVRPAQSLQQALLDLVSGDVDAMLMQGPLVEQTARATGLESRLARSARPLTEVSRAIAVAPGRGEVLRRLDAALAAYRDTPDFHALYRRWHAEPPSSGGIPPVALWGFGVALAALAGLLLLWRYVSLVRMNRRLAAALVARDQALAGLRLNQERMEALLRLTRMGASDTASVIDFALGQGVRLTGSGLGCLFFVVEGDPSPEGTHWLVESGPGQDAGAPPEAGTDLWEACLRTAAPVLDNDAASMPGGTTGRRVMAAPLVEDGVVTAVFGVADKAAPYDEADLRQLQLFLAGLGQVLAARRDAESIRRARDYAEKLIEGANAMIVGLDEAGRVTVFNTTAESVSGWPRAEVLGRPWHEILLPADMAGETAARYADFMAGRAAIPRQYEGPLLDKTGGIRRISWRNSLLRQGDGIQGILAYGIDVTGHRETSAELRRLHLAIEQAAEGVLIADGDGVLRYANPAMRRLAGLPDDWSPAGQDAPRTVYDLHLDLIEHHSSARAGAGQEGSWLGTCVFVRPEGAPVEVEFTVSGMRDAAADSLSFVAVCRDVTERRQLEHQLWQAQKMEALGTLAGGVAHDFNNMLASIMGFTELARDETPEGSRGRGFLDRVLKASLRARELVRQILSFSRRSEHKLRLLDADAVVAEALVLLGASLPRDIAIASRLESGATVLADPSQLSQIVMNLCTNAAQAMRGGGRIDVRTALAPVSGEVAARRRLPAGEFLHLVVEDRGPGVSPELMERIFDPFFTTKAPGEGTGLGLAVVHGIAASLGGAVWAENRQEGGARFELLLPAQRAAADRDRPESRPGGDLRGGEHILLVDDEPDVLEFGRQALSPLGYRLEAEPSPEAALTRVLKAPDAFDLVVTDMNMPGLSGIQLAEGLRPVRPDLPIVMISGCGAAVPPERLESLGAIRLLPKPFSMGELAQAVRLALRPQQGGAHERVHPCG